MRVPTNSGIKESKRTIGLAAALGWTASAPRTAARANMVVESASQSALKLLLKNGGRLTAASAAEALGKAEEWAIPPITWRNEARARRSLGAGFSIESFFGR